MTDLLGANIRQSVRLLEAGPPLLDANDVKVVGSAEPLPESLLMRIARDPLMPIPWFRMRDGVISSPQERFFGFYAVRGMVRGVLLGTPFLRAGRLLLKGSLKSPAVSMFYTAAFHALGSFLALRGRVVIEEVRGPVEIHTGHDSSGLTFGSLPRAPLVILAKLTARNTWVFEPRPRSHRARWQELYGASKEGEGRLPRYFEEFLSYADSYGPDEMGSDMEEVLRRVCDMRHAALYSAFGSDDFAVDLAINRESSGGGTELKAQAFADFSASLLLDVTTQTNELLHDLCIAPDVRKSLVANMLFPVFDLSLRNDCGSSELDAQVGSLLEWLFTSLCGESGGNQ